MEAEEKSAFVDRLYVNEAQKKKIKQEKVQYQKRKEQNRLVSYFKPQINKNSNKLAKKY